MLLAIYQNQYFYIPIIIYQTRFYTYLKDIVTKFDFGPSLKQRGRSVKDIIFDGMRTSLKLGLMGTYQWDRKREESQTIKAGFEGIFKARFKSLSVTNTFFSGDGFQYLYENKDLGGYKYGRNLYFGNRFYGYGLYDYAELAWTPHLGRTISLALKARFHFCEQGYIGNTQTLSFIFDLDRLRHPSWGAGRTGEPKPRKNPVYLSL